MVVLLTYRPVEIRSGAQETIIVGPYHNIILMGHDRDAQCVDREETWEGCPLTIQLWVWGSVVSYPMGVGAEPS